jgi:hypothetical protein
LAIWDISDGGFAAYGCCCGTATLGSCFPHLAGVSYSKNCQQSVTKNTKVGNGIQRYAHENEDWTNDQ